MCASPEAVLQSGMKLGSDFCAAVTDRRYLERTVENGDRNFFADTYF